MATLFELPDELLFASLFQQYAGREKQIRALATLLYPLAAPCSNLVVHGTGSTGKSAVVEGLLQNLAKSEAAGLKYAVINSIECVTGRHLFEQTVGKVAEALDAHEKPSRCENLSQLTVQLSKLIKDGATEKGSRFVLVFDAIDRQREAPPTLLPALGRLSDIIPDLTTIFIITSAPDSFLRTSFVPHVHFTNYFKSEFVQILSAMPPSTLPTSTADETAELWSRFCGAVYDALIKSAARTLPAFKQACSVLWPRFTAPILAGTHGPREFTKLLVAARVHFQDESALNPGIVAVSKSTLRNSTPKAPKAPELSALLPSTARILLLAAYLASHNANKHDLTLFSTHYHGRKRRRGGLLGRSGPRSKHRKIARKLLGAHAFVLERVMAIFATVRNEWAGASSGSSGSTMDCDVGMAMATLASLRLVVRVGGSGDLMDRAGKWRVNVGWEVIRGLGRSMGVEVEEWLID